MVVFRMRICQRRIDMRQTDNDSQVDSRPVSKFVERLLWIAYIPVGITKYVIQLFAEELEKGFSDEAASDEDKRTSVLMLTSLCVLGLGFITGVSQPLKILWVSGTWPWVIAIALWVFGAIKDTYSNTRQGEELNWWIIVLGVLWGFAFGLIFRHLLLTLFGIA